MGKTPPWFRSDPERGCNRVVGLHIMGTRVPVRGILGAGHPTTRQAQTQPGPGIPCSQALQTTGRMRHNLVHDGEMPTPATVGTAYSSVASSRHHAPFPVVH